MIILENVDYSYPVGDGGFVRALSGCSLKIKRGEFVTIAGSNGSGKSTLAKHLNALLLPEKGKVLVDGLDTSCEDNVWEIRRRVGMVFQNPDNQLVAAVSEEDVAFGPENLGLPPGEIRKRVRYYLDLLKLTEVKDRPPHLLSGGQKQRLAVAGVLAMEPLCIVLDEPTAMLDPAGRRELLQAVTKLNRELKVTVILITHLMEEAVFSQRMVLLHKGKIVMDGTLREIFARRERVEGYGLVLPEAAQLAEKLKAVGFHFQQLPLSIDELVDGLCGQLK
nr:energy-coupling factor transporter ATPase [Desulforadius tongensis]